jgi:hypothetical protein
MSEQNKSKELDLEQFEGHTHGPWYVFGKHDDDEGVFIESADGSRLFDNHFSDDNTKVDARLAASAPALLAEVKRLRSLLDQSVEDVLHEATYAVVVIDEYLNESMTKEDLLKIKTALSLSLGKMHEIANKENK